MAILSNAGSTKLKDIRGIFSKLEKADELYWSSSDNYYGIHQGLKAEFDTDKPEQRKALKELYDLGFRVEVDPLGDRPRTVAQAMERLLITREIFKI